MKIQKVQKHAQQLYNTAKPLKLFYVKRDAFSFILSPLNEIINHESLQQFHKTRSKTSVTTCITITLIE